MALEKLEEQGTNDAGGVEVSDALCSLSYGRLDRSNPIVQQRITTTKRSAEGISLVDHQLSFLATGLGMPTSKAH